MDMEIEFFLKNFDEKDPRLLMGHIQKMASGEAQFLSETLSLVYDRFFENNLRPPVPSSSGLGTPPVTGGQDISGSTHAIQASTPIVQQPDPTPNQSSSSTFGIAFPPSPQVSAPTLGPRVARLRCCSCGVFVRPEDLYNGMRCPICPERSAAKGRPRVKCELCHASRDAPKDICVNRKCQARFV